MTFTPAHSRRGAADAYADGALTFPGRTQPHSLDAEASLLACCLLDGRPAVTRCLAAKLVPESFYDPKHGLIYAALVALHARQDEIDAATVAVEMQQTGTLEKAGGIPFLTDVSKLAATTAGLTVFLRTVRETWILREVIRGAGRLIEEAYTRQSDLEGMLAPHVTWFQAALSRIVHGERAGFTLAQRVGEVKEELAARAEGREDKSRWICTGMEAFDRKCRPLGSDSEDHLTLIGGGSGHGKSALMRQWAGAALKAGQVVVNYTRETSVKGWIRQLASNWARVDLRSLEQAPADHAQRLQEECDRLLGYVDRSLFVFQQEPGCDIETIEGMVQHARAFAWQRGAPHLVVVDYLQLFGTKRRVQSREQEVAHVSHTLQALQRELGCVMIVGAQLNETGLREMRTSKVDDDGTFVPRMPGAGDFRESQAMYHDADRVIAIYRPPVDCRGTDNYGPDAIMPEQWLWQIKRRYGGEGAVKCWFEKRFLYFRQFGEQDHAAAEVRRPHVPEAPTKPARTKGDFRNQMKA